MFVMRKNLNVTSDPWDNDSNDYVDGNNADDDGKLFVLPLGKNCVRSRTTSLATLQKKYRRLAFGTIWKKCKFIGTRTIFSMWG